MTGRRSTWLLWAALLGCGEEVPVTSFDFEAGDWRTIASAPPVPEQIGVSIDGRRLALVDPDVLRYYRDRPLDSRARDAAETLLASAQNIERGFALFLRGELVLSEFEPVSMPDDPTWAEDPLGNQTWQFYYQQLILLPYLSAARGSASEEDRRAIGLRIAALLADWIADNTREPFPSAFSWHDHATAFRLSHSISTYSALLDGGLDDSLLSDLVSVIWLHANVLAFRSFYNRHSNHGFDQSMALFEAAALFPDLDGANDWRELGSSRLRDEAFFSFAPDGVHVENSPDYHFSILARLLIAHALLEHHGEAGLGENGELFNRSLRFATHIVRPDGLLPEIGDTSRRSIGERFASLAELAEHPAYLYSSTQGREGQIPRERFAVFPDSGYAVFRDAWRTSADFDQSIYLVYKCGYLARFHRHDDDNSIVLYGYGEDWLVDGGLWTYEEQDPIRQYLRSPRAHNLPLVDVAPTRARDVLLGNSKIARHLIAEDFAEVEGTSAMFPGVRVERTIRYTPPGSIRIVDRFTPEGPEPHRYGVLFHIPSDKTLEIEGTAVLARSSRGPVLRIAPMAALAPTIDRAVASFTFGETIETQEVAYELEASGPLTLELELTLSPE